MSDLLIPAAFAQQLHDYLLGRPMGEVEPLVAGLRRLQPAPQPTPQPSIAAAETAFATRRRLESGEPIQEH
jgi:hypothetical protein